MGSSCFVDYDANIIALSVVRYASQDRYVTLGIKRFSLWHFQPEKIVHVTTENLAFSVSQVCKWHPQGRTVRAKWYVKNLGLREVLRLSRVVKLPTWRWITCCISACASREQAKTSLCRRTSRFFSSSSFSSSGSSSASSNIAGTKAKCRNIRSIVASFHAGFGWGRSNFFRSFMKFLNCLAARRTSRSSWSLQIFESSLRKASAQ